MESVGITILLPLLPAADCTMDASSEEDLFQTDHDEDDPSRDKPISEKDFNLYINQKWGQPTT